ncbi:MAG TPA: 50S ribosomal protein L21 [Bacteroidales bacterium]|jgi:large subunit ribosomal protein L21|nr:50S ribosomal protein L21 [Bacteroidales bacterium]
MYAIVEIAGQQFKVEAGKKIFVHRLDAEGGKELDFDRVLLVDDDGKITVGTPTVGGVTVQGKILDHVRGDKVIVFKKKRKKGYRVKNGHRQDLTQVEILSIGGKSHARKTKKAAAQEAAPETAAAEASVEAPKEKKPRKPAAHKSNNEKE